MRCAIIQPSYIPWRGYFHQIQKADVFVFYDDVQYDKHGWRNRNRIKTANGSIWLTIPVSGIRGHLTKTPIKDVRISPHGRWQHKHWLAIQQSYAQAPYFSRYAPLLESAYARPPARLAAFTMDLTLALCRELGITRTRFVLSSTLVLEGAKTDRLISLLRAVAAGHYISGPSAKAYIDESALCAAGAFMRHRDHTPQNKPPIGWRCSKRGQPYRKDHGSAVTRRSSASGSEQRQMR